MVGLYSEFVGMDTGLGAKRNVRVGNVIQFSILMLTGGLEFAHNSFRESQVPQYRHAHWLDELWH